MEVIYLTSQSQCQPIANHERKIEDVVIAGKTLRQWQDERFQQAQLELACDVKKVYANGHALIGVEAIKAVLKNDLVLSHDGVVILSQNREDFSSEITIDVFEADSVFIRYPWDFLYALEELLPKVISSNKIEGELSPAAFVEGSLKLGEGSRVLPGVFIEGHVSIGRNCKVGPNCYIRGNTSIGDNCHIGQSVEIKNSLIMNGTNVGHLSYVGDSVLAEKVNFGAGTSTSNLRHDGQSQHFLIGSELLDTGRRKLGAIIGDGVHTGINTSIYPGRCLEAGATTLPGEIVRRNK